MKGNNPNLDLVIIYVHVYKKIGKILPIWLWRMEWEYLNMCLYAWLYMYVCLYVRLCVFVCTCECIYMCLFEYLCVGLYLWVYKHVFCQFMCEYVYYIFVC